MAYANLQDAGIDAYVNLYNWWQNGATLPNTMQARMLSFANACLPAFPDGSTNNHPVANWLALIAALATNIGAANAPNLTQLTDAAQLVYRCCLLTDFFRNTAVPALITAAQYTVMLDAFNTYLDAV